MMGGSDIMETAEIPLWWRMVLISINGNAGMMQLFGDGNDDTINGRQVMMS